MHRYSNFDGVSPTKIEIKATTTYIYNKIDQGLASKSLQELEQDIR
jgi:hypothetical protein